MQENIKQVIVKNTVMKEFKTAPIFQYDVGHVLSFEGFDLPEAFEVHFSLTEAGDAVTQVGSEGEVAVPDILVQDGRWLYAWLYISDQETGLTKFTIQIPVTRRARPTDQTPTPVEQSEIQQAIAALNAGVTRAETAAENAEQSEENASQSAENAYNSSEAAANAAESASGDARTATQKAQEALTSALDADRKAQNASESAQLASQKASEASGFADDAQGSAQSAHGYAQTAGQKATEATQSAENAAQKAQEALSSAQAAGGYANDAYTAKLGAENAMEAAQGYAGNASIMAQEATQSKNTAVEKAGEASQSADNAAQSAQAAQQTAQQFAQDITSLKSEISDVENAVGYYHNLWNPSAVVEGKYYANGAEVSNSNLHYIMIQCSPGDSLYFGDNGIAAEARFVNALTSGGSNLQTMGNVTTITAPDGCGKIAVSFNVSNTKPQINFGSLKPYTAYGKTTLEEDIEELSADLSNASAAITGLTTKVSSITQLEYGKNLCNTASNVGGYVNTSTGAIVDNSSSASTEFIEIGSDAVMSFGYNIANVSTLRYALYNASKTFLSGGTPTLVYSTTLNRYYYVLQTSGSAKYVRFSVSNTAWENTYCNAQVENNTEPTAYTAYTAPVIACTPDAMPEDLFNKNGGSITLKDNALSTASRDQIFGATSYEKQTSDSMGNNDTIEIDLNTSCKQRMTLAFKANITLFSSVEIGQSTGSKITVDGTNVYLYVSGALTDTEAHGLTISNNIDVVAVFGSGEIKVTVVSDGAVSNVTLTGYQNTTVTDYYAKSVGSTLTNCELVWHIITPNKKIWFFGDSYISYSQKRWLYYLVDAGYADNALIDGYPGEGGANSVGSFESLLNYGSPQIAVYMLGMNDGNDPDVSPSTWRTPRERFVSLCQSRNITPIFTLIPTVPSVKNDLKNQWVKDKGYRYIDFYGAVGANTSGAWYTDMLDEDNIHPTAKGAKALFGQLLVDLPEIMG